jgi:hypothetical protein
VNSFACLPEDPTIKKNKPMEKLFSNSGEKIEQPNEGHGG